MKKPQHLTSDSLRKNIILKPAISLKSESKNTGQFFVYGTFRMGGVQVPKDIRRILDDSKGLYKTKFYDAYVPYSKLFIDQSLTYAVVDYNENKYNKEQIVIGSIIYTEKLKETTTIFDNWESYPTYYNRIKVNAFNKINKDGEKEEIKKKKIEYLKRITSNSLVVVDANEEKKENEILPKILVIEDNQMISKSLINNLKAITNGKYNILLGVDGIDTLKFVMDDQFEGSQIKLIISDENMQFMNGSESLRILKNLELSGKIKGTKIVVSTTLIDSSMNDYFNKLGVFKVIDKAFEKSKMKQLLQDLNLL